MRVTFTLKKRLQPLDYPRVGLEAVGKFRYVDMFLQTRYLYCIFGVDFDGCKFTRKYSDIHVAQTLGAFHLDHHSRI